MKHRNTSAARGSIPASVDCRHSREPFDQGFHVVSRRADIGSDAKVVHAYLVTVHRLGQEPTQREMATALGLTRHRVWAALRELVAADLIQAIRYGLGRPNGYVLLGLSDDDLAGRKRPETGVRPVRSQHSGQSGNLARTRQSGLKNNEKNRVYTPAPGAGVDYLGGSLAAYIKV